MKMKIDGPISHVLKWMKVVLNGRDEICVDCRELYVRIMERCSTLMCVSLYMYLAQPQRKLFCHESSLCICSVLSIGTLL